MSSSKRYVTVHYTSFRRVFSFREPTAKLQHMTLFRRIPLVYWLLTLGYVAWCAALFAILPTQQFPDTNAYVRSASLSPLSGDFWSYWRASSFALFLRVLGRDFDLTVLAQTVFYALAWLTFAGMVARRLHHPRLAMLGFASVLWFSLGLDVFVWNRVVLTESLDITLSLFALSALLLWESEWSTTPSRRRQIGFGLLLGALAWLWGFSRPANYYIMAGLVLVLLAFMLWRRDVSGRWRYSLAVLLVAMLSVSAYRYWNVSQDELTELTIMQKITSEVMLEPDQTAFFVARGMPYDATAQGFAGWVPPRYAGDWQAVFGHWLDDRGPQTMIEFVVRHPGESLLEPLLEWQKTVDPNMIVNAIGRNPDATLATLQAEHRVLMHNTGALGALVWLVAGLGMAWRAAHLERRSTPPQPRPEFRQGTNEAPTNASRPEFGGSQRGDNRPQNNIAHPLPAWLPVGLVLVGAAWGVWNWNFNHYEPRQLLLLSVMIRLGALLLLLYAADALLRRPDVRRGLVWGLLAVALLFEMLPAWGPTRSALYQTMAPLAPTSNWLASWDVSENEYRVFQHVPLEADVLRLQTDIIDGEIYPRQFVLRWGEFDQSGELITVPGQGLHIVWRNDPRPDEVYGPFGPVFGPVPYDAAPDFPAWQANALPGLLPMPYLLVDAVTWQTLPPYQARLLRNPALYRPLHTWADGAALLARVGDARDFTTLADPDAPLGLTPEHAAAFAASPPGPIFAPDTGVDPRHIVLTYGGLLEATWPEDDDARAAMFELLGALDVADYQMQLTDAETLAALAAWRAEKTAANLRAAGYEYLLINAGWWGWLTAEEQARFEDSGEYTRVATWQGDIPGWYRLYYAGSR